MVHATASLQESSAAIGQQNYRNFYGVKLEMSQEITEEYYETRRSDIFAILGKIFEAKI